MKRWKCRLSMRLQTINLPGSSHLIKRILQIFNINHQSRFVNMLQLYGDIDSAWKIVKQVRKKFLTQIADPECHLTSVNQIGEHYIKTNIDDVENYLTIKPAYDDNLENITAYILKAGAEMFTFLNFCPPETLLKFYKEILLQGSTKDIILGITNIMKTRRNAHKSTATEVWNELNNKLKCLKYKMIESVTLRHNNNSIGKDSNQSCFEELKSLGKEIYHHGHYKYQSLSVSQSVREAFKNDLQKTYGISHM